MNIHRIVFILLLFTLPNATIGQESAGPLSDSAPMQEEWVIVKRTLRIDDRTIIRGITLSVDEGKTLLAIPPGMLSAPSTVTIEKSVVQETYDAPQAMERSLVVTRVAIDGDKLSVRKPYRIVERIQDPTYVPVLLLADEAREQWVRPQRQGVRWKQKEVWAESPRTRAQWMLAADTARHLIGRATWYPDRLTKDTRWAAASNDYPLRTRLKVTNIQTNESVIVTVQSVGPFVNGRILDLTHSAFSKIGYPRKQGVITVAVEPQ